MSKVKVDENQNVQDYDSSSAEENLKQEQNNESKIAYVEDASSKGQQTKKEKRQRNFVINSANMAIIASSIALALNVIHKLLRMLLVVSAGLIVTLYVLAGILCFIALFSAIKYGFKEKSITVDAFLTGIAFVTLILI